MKKHLRHQSQQACTILAGLLWFIAFVLAFTPVSRQLPIFLYILSLGLASIRMLKPVWHSIRSFSLDMNLLMGAAVIGAIFLQEWAEGAMIVWLFALADWIEDKSMARTSKAIESLMHLSPDRVRIIRDNDTEELVPPEEVPVGSRLRLRPGERVGLDAEVEAGCSQVIQAQITGEPLPVDVSPGDTIYAGSVNGNGTLMVKTTKPAGESTVARIIKLVQEARRTKAPLQKNVERFARYYTPMVFICAILLTLIPVVFLQQPLHIWGYRSLVILLVGCPCAFIIATPVTLVSGLTVAAHHGILIKGGAALEQAARINAMIFDKTGTLTTGRPVVQKIISHSHNDKEICAIAAAISGESGHLLGKALAVHCQKNAIPIPKAENISLQPGRGATGTIQGKPLRVGGIKAFAKDQIPADTQLEMDLLQDAGCALVCIGSDADFYGVIGLADIIRPEVQTALLELKHLGLQRLVLLSGDHQHSVDNLARTLPLDDARGECLPETKLEVLRTMHNSFGITAMVGDGINDAPALAGADLGIAMGAGSDQALETADVALMTEDTNALPFLIKIARKTTRRVKCNIAIALILKFGFLALASMGGASLWLAVMADTGASLLVITIGLSLLREKV